MSRCRNRSALLRTILFVLGIFTPCVSATDFYVAPEGSDRNPGSLQMPWRTLANVTRRAFGPGDVIHFARGGMYSGCLEITASGTRQNPIVFRSYGKGPAPRFSNPRFDHHSGRILQITGSHIVVEDLAFFDTPTPPPDKPPVVLAQSVQHKRIPELAAVFIAKEASHVVIQNCDFSNCVMGVRVRGHHCSIRHNWLHDAAKLTEQWGAIAVVVVGPDNEIAYNLIENYGYYGGNFGLDGAAIELDGEDPSFDGRRSRIHHNISRNTKGGFLEITGRTRDVTVAYNVSEDIDKFVGTVGVQGLRITNNTVVRMRNPEVAPRTFWTFNTKDADEITITRNIFYLGAPQFLYRSAQHPKGFSGANRANNFYFSPDGNVDAILGEPLAPSEIVADPLFTHLSRGVLTLKPGSPARNAGAYPEDAAKWSAGIQSTVLRKHD